MALNGKALMLGVSALALTMGGGARAAAPDNLAGGLRELVSGERTLLKNGPVMTDRGGRVLVDIHLAQGARFAAVRDRVAALGAGIEEEAPHFHAGLIEAHIRLSDAAAIAAVPGVRSVEVIYKPVTNIGIATSQGVQVMKANQLLDRGITGKGITVAALSDSFNTDTTYPASKDVLTGDLPGTGNPDHDTRPVVVLKEGPAATDEGRGMLQIVHDMAPDAKLCFATAFDGPAKFAKYIQQLADPKGRCKADIVVDDVGYSNEPVFSDENVISQAVNTVASQGTLYFSSAGNGNQGSYNATFNPIDPATAQGLPNQPVKLKQVPTALIAGGVHNFGTADNPVIAQRVETTPFGGAADLALLQWNDPFNLNAITANYVILVFDAQGNFDRKDSGKDDAFKTDRPLQTAQLPTSQAGITVTRYIVLAKQSTAASPATQLRWSSFYQAATRQITFNQDHSPAIQGHPGAAGAVAVAADYWGATASTEYFSSQGPFTNYFDAKGNRLNTPEVRQKPEIATTDGVDTTFFGQAVPNSAFPAFFGTSAAAPHAAGVAALVLQAAGGHGKVSPNAMRTVLENSAGPHILSPGYVQAVATSTTGASVTAFVHGYQPQAYQADQFGITVTAPSGVTLKSISYDAFPSGNIFDAPFTFGSSNNLSSGQVSVSQVSPPTYGMTLTFASGAFTSGTYLNFSIDFDNAALNFAGINSGLMTNATISAVFSDGSKATATIAPTAVGYGWSWDDGYGLVDAVAAAAQVGH